MYWQVAALQTPEVIPVNEERLVQTGRQPAGSDNVLYWLTRDHDQNTLPNFASVLHGG